MLLLALSCLQGRPMNRAFDELSALADGVQLTPGNHPTAAFSAHVARSGKPTRTHHGFSYEHRALSVWSDGVVCLATSDSVHPPELTASAGFSGFALAVEEEVRMPCLETMYPGYALGCGAELEWAMARALPLAVDVSHLFIQRERGVIGEGTLARLFDYDAISEVHVSANDGARDLHAPLDASTFGLAWARARERAGTPVVLECFMHKLSDADRRRQVALLKE
jgi:hypothetical protein